MRSAQADACSQERTSSSLKKLSSQASVENRGKDQFRQVVDVARVDFPFTRERSQVQSLQPPPLIRAPVSFVATTMAITAIGTCLAPVGILR
jgi:hypothetical protein